MKSELYSAIKANDMIRVDNLLSSGEADVNAAIHHKNHTPLHVAATENQNLSHHGVIFLLLKHGANVNAQDDNGETPLHHVITKSNLKVVNLLISYNANVDVVDNFGQTPFFNAARSGKLEIAQLLVDRGADVNRADNDGRTPLHFACFESTGKLIRFEFQKI